MEIDDNLLWKLRPGRIPGQITSLTEGKNGRYIRLLIDFNYPNGKKFYDVMHDNLPNFKPDDYVIFTLKDASPNERKDQKQPDLMRANQVRSATLEEIDAAIEQYKLSCRQDVMRRLNEAQETAEQTIKDAQDKQDEYKNKLAGFDQKLKQKTDEIVAIQRRELEEWQKKLEKREDVLAPYMKAIKLTPEEDTQIDDVPMPKELAARWPQLLETSGYSCDAQIAVAFLLCVAASAYSGSIVLLNGPVGVGKTRLVNETARSLGGYPDVIAVRPAWIDPSDLLGFFDPINDTFRPTPFTTALRNAKGDRLRLVCLDELNLARIENYAADLLSGMEYSRSRSKNAQEGQGHIRLYSEDLQQQLCEEAKDIEEEAEQATRPEKQRQKTIQTLLNHYPAHFKISKEVVLIGTLNSDETTFDLSPKMIDRSYTITFPPTDFDSNKSQPKTGEAQPAPLPVSALLAEIDTVINDTPKHWKTVLEWNAELQRFGIPLGHRTKRDYDVFRAAGSVLGLSEKDCLGYFLFCKILPRIFFFKGQNNTDANECREWLTGLKQNYDKFGPAKVIDNVISQCDDNQVTVVRYWSKS